MKIEFFFLVISHILISDDTNQLGASLEILTLAKGTWLPERDPSNI